jgi:hypothetical protein
MDLLPGFSLFVGHSTVPVLRVITGKLARRAGVRNENAEHDQTKVRLTEHHCARVHEDYGNI